jgi:hypothetical protein
MRWIGSLVAAMRREWSPVERARRAAVLARARCEAEDREHRRRWTALNFEAVAAEERYSALLAAAAQPAVPPAKSSGEISSVVLF